MPRNRFSAFGANDIPSLRRAINSALNSLVTELNSEMSSMGGISFTSVAVAGDIPTAPNFGDEIWISGGNNVTTAPILVDTQLFQAGGDPVLLADYSDGTGGTTTGDGAVFADIGSALDNLQLNTGSDRENNSVAYSVIVTNGDDIIVRENVNAAWRVWGAAQDSSPNGNQLRVRVEANSALQLAANPGWQVGFRSEQQPTLTAGSVYKWLNAWVDTGISSA